MMSTNISRNMRLIYLDSKIVFSAEKEIVSSLLI